MKSRAVMLSLALVVSLSIVFLAAASSAGAAAPAEFYVSLAGNDQNKGTLERPFATLERARDAIRQLKSGGKLRDGATVFLRGGTYPLSRTLEFSELDSGSKQAPVVYRPYKSEEVHLSGGRELKAFSPVSDRRILDRLPAGARGKVVQASLPAQGVDDLGEVKRRGFDEWGVPSGLELFFSGEPMTLARWPNAGWETIASVPPGSQNGTRFAYRGSRPARWYKAEDLWLHGYWNYDWADTHLKVAWINEKGHEIAVRQPPVEFGFRKGARWRALNLLEELDEPGEWYLERKTGTLYFWPPGQLSRGTSVVSVLPGIVSLSNTSHLTIRGLTMEYCRATAVVISGGEGNRIAGCTVRNAGTTGIDIEGGSNNGVEGSNIYNTGEGGIVLSGGERRTLAAAGNFALNNDIHHFSRWVRTYTPGIALNGVGNRVAHNLIHDAPHTAILLHGNDHVIEYNEIHHVCQETSDAGAFYMGRDYTERGNVVRFNYFHDLGMGDVQAIYLDDFASGTRVFGNVVYRAGRALQLGGGRDNTIENNIFIDCKTPSIMDARGLSWYRKYFDGTDTTLSQRMRAVDHRRPPYSTRYPELVTLYDRDPARPENNAFVRNISVGGPLLELKDGLTERTVKLEGNLEAADPGFVDRARRNFQLKQGSPALRRGFRPIPMERIGLYRDEYRK